jgi:hypothetical protein
MAPLNLQEMPQAEKLRTMHLLWEDLANHSDSIESPDWHQSALQQTAEDLKFGRIQELDWESAKREMQSLLR